MFFVMKCGWRVFFFLRFYEHIAFHKAFHKHKNDISIFPHKWQICRKRKNQQDSLETVLYTPQECERSPLLALTSVTHADVLLEAKINSSTSRRLAGWGQARRDGAASEKCIHSLESLMKSTEPFSGAPNCFYFPIKRKKGEKNS